jgi:PilZ domain
MDCSKTIFFLQEHKATCGQSLIILIFANLFGVPDGPRKCEGRGIKKASENSIERRKTTRYRMRAQVIFRWGVSHKDRFLGEGTTRDVSLTGAYVLTATCPPVNEMVQMEIIFPPLFTTSSTRMRAKMKVLRVENDAASERPGGFSIVGKGFSVRAVSKQLSAPVIDFANRNGAKN